MGEGRAQGGGTMVRMEMRGKLMAGGAVALAAVGFWRVDGALLALGAAGFLMLALAGCLGWWNLRGLVVEVEGPEVVQAGRTAGFGFAVVNGRRLLDGFGLDLEVKGPGGLRLECRVPWVPAGSGAEVDFRVEVAGRGRATGLECVLGSGFPLGMFRFSRRIVVGHRLLVLPRARVPRELVAAGSSLDAEARERATAAGVAGELRGLRPYRPGDRAKGIAWPASLRSRARGGGVLVREEDPPGEHPRRAVVVFHSHGGDGALIRPDRFERALGLLWGTLGHFQAQGVAVELVADFEEWVPRRVVTRRELGEAGAMLAAAARARGTELHELQGRLDEADAAAGLVVVSDMPPELWESRIALPRRRVVVDVRQYERGAKLKGHA